MASTPPVAIGTWGTVGSLVRREIEYFSKFELGKLGGKFTLAIQGRVSGS